MSMQCRTDAPAVVIEPVPERVTVGYQGEKYEPAPAVRAAIEREWNARLATGVQFTRGIVFHVASIRRRGDEIRFETVMTDYAHYLYTIGATGRPEPCRVAYTAALLRTRDDRYLVGEMAPTTSAPHRLQCAGGGLDLKDFHDGVADLEANIRGEIREETGLVDAHIARLQPAYLKSGGEHGFHAIVYRVDLRLDAAAALRVFSEHCRILGASGEVPEFVALVDVPAVPDEVRRFLAVDARPRVDYLGQLLLIDATPVV